jgi:hypothetical protein
METTSTTPTEPVIRRNAAGRRLPSTAWVKGQPSPNPKGMPPGIPTLVKALREAVEARQPELVDAFLNKAIAGNADAMRLIAERFAPASRTKFAPVAIPGLAEASTLREKVTAVQAALANGTLAADHAGAIIAGLKDAELALQVEAMREELASLRAELIIDQP